MLKVNVERIETELGNLQAQYDSVVSRAKNVCGNIPNIAEPAREAIMELLVAEYGGDCAKRLEYIKGFFDEVPESVDEGIATSDTI